MVRGCQRRVIHLKKPDSPVFEEAFFILKDNETQKPPSRNEMVREANRILQENMTGEGGKKERSSSRLPLWQRLLWFLAGAAASGGTTAVILSL